MRRPAWGMHKAGKDRVSVLSANVRWSVLDKAYARVKHPFTATDLRAEIAREYPDLTNLQGRHAAKRIIEREKAAGKITFDGEKWCS